MPGRQKYTRAQITFVADRYHEGWARQDIIDEYRTKFQVTDFGENQLGKFPTFWVLFFSFLVAPHVSSRQAVLPLFPPFAPATKTRITMADNNDAAPSEPQNNNLTDPGEVSASSPAVEENPAPLRRSAAPPPHEPVMAKLPPRSVATRAR